VDILNPYLPSGYAISLPRPDPKRQVPYEVVSNEADGHQLMSQPFSISQKMLGTLPDRRSAMLNQGLVTIKAGIF
jgi:hypothetical protein